MCEIESGICEICGNEGPLLRTYFYYGIKCDCHSPEHFELIRHCQDCVPKPPNMTTVYMKPVTKQTQ